MNESGGGGTTSNFRLSDKVIPSHYALTLFPEPNSETGEFKGEETISITVLEETSTISLHVNKIDITCATISDGVSGSKGTVTVDEETELAKITFTNVIKPGQWKLDLQFTGTHKQQLRGFYISTWTDEAGKKHRIATTQHEATEARKSFPCFDEPAMKAVFEVKMVIDNDLVALSNARNIGEVPYGEGKKMVTFAPSPKMSTYLTCFIVGEFESSEPAFVNGKEVRIWCVKGKKHLTSWALKSSVHALKWFEEYFDVPYFGGDKIDHVAIPDFEAGAMENPGCVTYRETALLCDEATTPHAQKESIAVTNQHETAHFWFGDLVTMRW
jgi:puromycin-sensitive aminopeptidase